MPLIEIAICFDENLLLPAVVLLHSIEENAGLDRPVRVYALTTFDVQRLHDLVPKPNGNGFELIAIPVANLYRDLPRNDYISQGTYLRFLLPGLLSDVAKLIYLDVDMIVHRDLGPLFDVDIGAVGLAATSDVALTLGSTRWDHFDLDYEGRSWTFADYMRDVLDLPNERGDDYFNAGLLVIDLDHWRRNDIARRTLDFLARKPKLKFMDQDALSHVIKGNYVRLDTRWNAMANCADKADRRLKTRLAADGRKWERAREIWRDEPWIVHYAGPHKPWHTQRPVAHGDLWWSYARQTPVWSRLAGAHEKYCAICRRAAERDRPYLLRLAKRALRR